MTRKPTPRGILENLDALQFARFLLETTSHGITIGRVNVVRFSRIPLGVSTTVVSYLAFKSLIVWVDFGHYAMAE